jgi:hypothetical protein
MWFVDVFGESSERFLPDWHKHKSKSHNKPQYKKSYEIFKKFIVGATPAELGYVYNKNIDSSGIGEVIRQKTRKKSYHILRYRVVPQGLIYLLFHIYKILFSIIDKERKLIRIKTTEINETLKNVPQDYAIQILSNVQSGQKNHNRLGRHLTE